MKKILLIAVVVLLPSCMWATPAKPAFEVVVLGSGGPARSAGAAQATSWLSTAHRGFCSMLDSERSCALENCAWIWKKWTRFC